MNCADFGNASAELPAKISVAGHVGPDHCSGSRPEAYQFVTLLGRSTDLVLDRPAGAVTELACVPKTPVSVHVHQRGHRTLVAGVNGAFHQWNPNSNIPDLGDALTAPALRGSHKHKCNLRMRITDDSYGSGCANWASGAGSLATAAGAGGAAVDIGATESDWEWDAMR